MLKKGDLILIGAILIAGIISYAAFRLYNLPSEGTARIAVVKQNNEIIKTINLDNLTETQSIEVNGEYYNIVVAENGRIRFSEANCPDLVCVKTGWLSKKGEIAVCLPNKVSIEIEGHNEEVDGVAF